jgi:hypothetical protein
MRSMDAIVHNCIVRGKPFGNSMVQVRAVAYAWVTRCGREFPNGDKYAGTWKYGQLHGHGKMVWADGSSYQVRIDA